MENIDISDMAFSLGEGSGSGSGSQPNDTNELFHFENYNILYLVGAFVFIISCFFVYTYYFRNKKTVTFQDKLDTCYGGVCER